jgi:hypothetical protein
MRRLIRILLMIAAFIGLLLITGWLGLQVKARSFPAVARGLSPRLVPIPAHLPEPVQRFARAVYGDSIPEVQSAVAIGRASLAPTGFPMPTRFRFYYDAEHSSHYHDIAVTWFDQTFIRIHERNLEGHVTLDLSILGGVDDAPKTNRAGIQGYWGEVLAWVPSIALTDSRVRWEAVDATTARLYLPGLDDEEAFTVRFDPATGLLSEIETMRYQDEARDERWRWFNRVLEWGEVDGLRVPVVSQTQWREDAPWATWEVEQVVLNVDVSARLAQFGGDVVE